MYIKPIHDYKNCAESQELLISAISFDIVINHEQLTSSIHVESKVIMLDCYLSQELQIAPTQINYVSKACPWNCCRHTGDMQCPKYPYNIKLSTL